MRIESSSPAGVPSVSRRDVAEWRKKMAQPMPIAKQTDNKADLVLLPGLTNRHGLVAGATGTGKTVTLQVIAEALSRNGVPVFAADVKGDLSGISQPGQNTPKLAQRLKTLGMDAPAFV